MSNYSNIFVLIPSLNPDNNLISLVNELSKNKWGGILVVDDGSSQNARKIFNDITKIKGVNVVSHTENKGKGSALKTGMKYIKNHANNISKTCVCCTFLKTCKKKNTCFCTFFKTCIGLIWRNAKGSRSDK